MVFCIHMARHAVYQ